VWNMGILESLECKGGGRRFFMCCVLSGAKNKTKSGEVFGKVQGGKGAEYLRGREPSRRGKIPAKSLRLKGAYEREKCLGRS